jgi:hypothetical protein
MEQTRYLKSFKWIIAYYLHVFKDRNTTYHVLPPPKPLTPHPLEKRVVCCVIFCQYFPIFHCYTHRVLLLHSHMLTYLLTASSRVLLEKLTGSQLVKKFPSFYGTQRFISAFTSARHLLHTCLLFSCRGFIIQ